VQKSFLATTSILVFFLMQMCAFAAKNAQIGINLNGIDIDSLDY
jgi:hypothetical protein